MKNPSKINLIIFMFILFIGGRLIPERISITITPSLRNRIYLLNRYPRKDTIKRNRFVLFTLNTELTKNLKTKKVIKKVACAEGDQLAVRGLYYYCNERYLGVAKEYTLDGKELDHFVYEGTIPKGKIFVYSHHIDSYDSKYYGFVEEEDVLAIAYPLL